ncbi:MAG: hypothetical protein ACPGGA_09620 [Balneolaceae bacterium]
MDLIVRVISVFVVIIAVIAGLYFGFQYGIYLLDNEVVDLGDPAGNLLYPLFMIITSAAGGVVSLILAGLVYFILEKTRLREGKTY